MPVPPKRRSRSKKRRGQAHLALKTIRTIKCKKCGSKALPHRVCPTCGTYQGREVIKPKVKKKKPSK